MTHTDPFSHEFPGSWNLLGEIEFPAGPAAASHISAWLVETLRALDLNGRLLNKITAAAQLAAERAPSITGEADPAQVRLRVYTPEDTSSNGKSWGFFRVEKKGDPQAAGRSREHAIAFYLYREGM